MVKGLVGTIEVIRIDIKVILEDVRRNFGLRRKVNFVGNYKKVEETVNMD